IDDTETEKCMITGNDAYYILKRLDMESYKNKNGSILVVGGSKMYSGAPFLTGKSALRAGAGIVTVAIPNSLQTCAPGIFALITRRIEDDGTGFFTDSSIPELKKLAEKADVIVIGPGMSDKQCCAGVFREILKLDKPKIVDADGLNLIAKDPAILTEKNGETVFTPHPGEAARLFKGFRENTDKYKRRADKAKKLSELLNGTVVYKGNRTVTLTPGRMPCINSSGGPALATAGSGDVLTGIIAANIGAGMSQYRASYLAAYLHGIAGEIADKGARGLIADDIAELIPYALKRASPFA
ncbi:MAG: NAD(P)H-hydrate dehydratase, partial [Victivallales bacterium]|nr:NAD(P)H-hydrate dehydratase [Victivallales bacterium]